MEEILTISSRGSSALSEGRVRRGIAAFAVALLLSACGTGAGERGSSSTDTHKSGLTLTAEIDPDSSSVQLPIDHYQLTDWETNEITSALSVATAVCARERLGIKDYGVPNSERPQPEQIMFSELGPWTTTMADSFGFAPPATKNQLSASGLIPKPKNEVELDAEYQKYQVSEEDSAKILATCGEGTDYPDEKRFSVTESYYSGPWVDEISHTWEQTLADKRTKEVVADLKKCYTDSGLVVSDSKPTDGDGGDGRLPIAIEGADPTKIDQTQIEMANKVVACKQKTDAIKRITAVWAEKQAPIVERYADELVAQRQKIDKKIAEAKAYIDAHRDAMQPVQKPVW